MLQSSSDIQQTNERPVYGKSTRTRVRWNSDDENNGFQMGRLLRQLLLHCEKYFLTTFGRRCGKTSRDWADLRSIQAFRAKPDESTGPKQLVNEATTESSHVSIIYSILSYHRISYPTLSAILNRHFVYSFTCLCSRHFARSLSDYCGIL